MAERSGVLIALEGCDGCGKSTQASLLSARLTGLGLPVGPADAPGTVVREPGGTPLGEAIRRLLLHDASPGPWAEALLYAAARAELVERVLLPALESGRVLVLDRYLDSSLAYQGFARGLGIDEVLGINGPGLQGLVRRHPSAHRQSGRGSRPPGWRQGRPAGSPRERSDRIDAEGLEFQQRVEAGYAAVACRFPGRVRLIDGLREIAAVAVDVEAAALRRSAPPACASAAEKGLACSIPFPASSRSRSSSRGRCATGASSHAYLLSGPEGLGKTRFARELAVALVSSCGGCGACPECARARRGVHPDLHVVEPEGDVIRVEQVDPLIADLSLKPFGAERRVWLLPEVDHLHPAAANKLLKSIEEPPQHVFFLLVSDHLQRVLPTIVSRCQLVEFRPLSDAEVAAYLGESLGLKGVEAESLARLAAGSVERAARLAEDARGAGRRAQYLRYASALLTVVHGQEATGSAGLRQRARRPLRRHQGRHSRASWRAPGRAGAAVPG